MSSPQLVGPGPRGTAEPGSRRKRRRALPQDLLREASRRLGIMSLLGAGLWAIASALGGVTFKPHDGHVGWQPARADNVIAACSVAVSIALFFYSRKRDRDPRFVLDLGLGYMVFMAFALGNLFHWEPVSAGVTVNPMISWIGVLVLIFAAIVPTRPQKILIAGIVAASMNPIGMAIAKARGMWDFGPMSGAFYMHYPDYVLVGVAVVVSRVLTRLGHEVTTAREMGSYRLGELLGRGGMGEVYKATHRMLARPAAIKLIRPEILSERTGEAAQIAAARFRREAEAAASLRSPHTVELYDFGATEDQTLYLVMELLEGMDLDAMVRLAGPLPAARAIHILRQVCESLEEAHARGLVHRDIKPANIHVGRLGLRHDFVKVLDFGLVKSAASPGKEKTLETGLGVTPGTPAYMAPEVATGSTIDARADIYALGCVAYFALTGALVFEATTAVQVIAMHLHADPVPLSTRTDIAVPAELDSLILSCLAKRPENRPPDAGSLGRSLAAIATAPWDEVQAKDWWDKNWSAS